MPRNRDDSPLEARRRQLAEQEKLLAQKRQELKQQLESAGSPDMAAKVDEPPVWRMEDEHHDRPVDPTPLRRRHLARQRRRDMVLFFACIALLLIVIVVLMLVAYIHIPAQVNGT